MFIWSSDSSAPRVLSTKGSHGALSYLGLVIALHLCLLSSVKHLGMTFFDVVSSRRGHLLVTVYLESRLKSQVTCWLIVYRLPNCLQTYVFASSSDSEPTPVSFVKLLAKFEALVLTAESTHRLNYGSVLFKVRFVISTACLISPLKAQPSFRVYSGQIGFHRFTHLRTYDCNDVFFLSAVYRENWCAFFVHCSSCMFRIRSESMSLC